MLVDIDCFLIYLLCKSILYLIEHFSWDLNTNCDMLNCIFKNKNHLHLYVISYVPVLTQIICVIVHI